MQHHLLRLTVGHEIGEHLKLFLRNLQRLHHGLEQVITMTFLIAAELHQSEQQQGFLFCFDLSLKGGTDRTNATLRVKILVVHQVISTPEVAIEAQIGVDISDTELMAQKVHKHGFCPCFIHLFFFAKQGKQT